MTNAMFDCISLYKQSRYQIKCQVMHPSCNNNWLLRKQFHDSINRVEFFEISKMKVGYYQPCIYDAKQSDDNTDDEFVALKPERH